MNYLKMKATIPYEIMVFTDKNAVREFLKENEPDVLMANDEGVLKLGREHKISKILKLSEEQICENLVESMEYHPIFKYQSTEKLVREMLGYCVDGFVDAEGKRRQGTQGKIIGVYGPVGRCYKTTFSLALADALSKKCQVLYLNLEEYTGLADGLLRGEQGGLSEIMYMFRRGAAGISVKIRELTGRINQFDYIPPVDYPEDVLEVMEEEWINFFEFLLGGADYEYLIVDLGNLVKKPWQFFEVMSVVFMPEVTDIIGQRKRNAFMEVMRNTGRGILLENIVSINVPYDRELESGEISMGKIEWSTVGNFARKVVNERGL